VDECPHAAFRDERVRRGRVHWEYLLARHRKYDYPPDARVTIHEDTWKPGPSITFGEHTGRGYWAGETWKEC
jgi:hypothetical protein